MLRNESPERQNQIVARIFSALSMKFPEDDTATEDMLAEWREALAELDMDAITARVEYWKGQGRTCPADEFVAHETASDDTQPEKALIGNSQMTASEIVAKAKKLYSESDQTFEQAYKALGLHTRWGELPRGRDA